MEKGISPKEYIDSVAPTYEKFLHLFHIKYDNFYRTSSEDHSKKVQTIWTRLIDRGDIYKKSYKGKYCVGCESFKLDKELLDGICLDHPTTKIEEVEEENYFFRISKYKDVLLEWIKSDREFLQPQSKINELINLAEGIEDISISRLRRNCPWGTIVPGDSEQTIYIWFSALLNYIFAAGYLTDSFNWDYIIQTCGIDNIRFQAIIFQSILESERIKKSDKLLIHGTILDKNGRKMSKTFGNVVDPIDQLNKYGVDAIRYYCLGGLSTYSNSSWDESELVLVWNDLANSWGNLVSRTLHLVDKFGISEGTNELESNVNILYKESIDLWNNYEIKLATQKTNEIVRVVNKWISDNEPWKSKSQVDIGVLYRLLSVINDLYSPVIPESCDKVREAIQDKKKSIVFNKII